MIFMTNLVEPFTNNQILLFLLVIYLIILYLSVKFDRRIMFIASIIWFIPITWIDNILLITVFVIMFLLHITIPLNSLRGDNDDFS